ncbi:MAG: cob(I)yrinic acid a,c-diamide adenosyltransferase [Nitrospirae bacterium]|nr:cob(I)yrinic acid a,c-diamide adenosyltransferase [Nitrospirota bacterium]
MSKGLIHVYTGEGQGKTTAAIGLAVRAAGRGKKVLILQFLKGRGTDSGEIIAAKKFKIKVVRFKGQVSPIFNPQIKPAELKKAVKKAIAFTIKEIKSKSYDMIILDEFNNLLSGRLADMNDVRALIKEKPAGLELVFTGRKAPEGLIKIADYVTEMRMVKHPFYNGITARRGIEF